MPDSAQLVMIGDATINGATGLAHFNFPPDILPA
jgi:hypothetical protein